VEAPSLLTTMTPAWHIVAITSIANAALKYVTSQYSPYGLGVQLFRD
jgi:hypothetical protein